VKVCGITSIDDAEMALEAGVDALGLNFVETSKRFIDRRVAREIARSLAGRIELVAVVANRGLDDLMRLRDELGMDFLQLHGDEPPGLLAALLPQAFKAVRIGGLADIALAKTFGGDRLLLDAKADGGLGGTGHTFEWTLAGDLCLERRVILAGGLTPDNVGEAVQRTRPFGVDAASGVEFGDDPRRKDPSRVRDFVRAAKAARSDRR
jgi:phosphoribosylanthranilate isomerase